jgi:hypothetical protein
MIERIEVTPGTGTVIRYGGIVAWTDPAASPALISFLAQSARNLGPSPRGGRQIADHIAGVLAARDPEPHVAFAVVGPSDHGWASLLHGPVQVWDGARWLTPTPSPGWLQAIITPRPAITVVAAGMPAPPLQPDAMWDLEAGVVPGAGFVLTPGEATSRMAVVHPPVGESAEPGDDATNVAPIATPEVEPAEAATTAARASIPPAMVVSVPGAEKDTARHEDDAGRHLVEAGLLGAAAGLATEPERGPGPEATTAPVPAAAVLAETGPEPGPESAPEPAPESAEEGESAPVPEPEPVPERPVAPGPAGSLDLRAATALPGQPLPRGNGPAHPVPGATVVAGVLCARGHLNRPGLPACARCHTPMPAGARDQVSGTRPPLGVLFTDDGILYRLDRGYLVGSNSSRDPTVGGGLARPLVLNGSDVSGSHAEIRLTDWDVTVVDRGSAAGTCIYEPGTTEWARLRPYEPRVLAPGTHIAFGQRVVTFISPWVPSV